VNPGEIPLIAQLSASFYRIISNRSFPPRQHLVITAGCAHLQGVGTGR